MAASFKTVNGTKTYSNNWSDPISFTTYLTVNRISYSNINSKGATLNLVLLKIRVTPLVFACEAGAPLPPFALYEIVYVLLPFVVNVLVEE